jgi:putative endonuclease
MNRRLTGSHWERRAETFLRRQGLKTLERNFYCRSGEIDLVMQDQDSLVFVEVRYRKRDSHGSGAESIGPVKQSRLIRAARYYLGRNLRYSEKPCRFDVISVGESQGQPCFRWIRHAFEVARG